MIELVWLDNLMDSAIIWLMMEKFSEKKSMLTDENQLCSGKIMILKPAFKKYTAPLTENAQMEKFINNHQGTRLNMQKELL